MILYDMITDSESILVKYNKNKSVMVALNRSPDTPDDKHLRINTICIHGVQDRSSENFML